MEISLLTIWAVLIGSAMLAGSLAFLAFPETMKAQALAFPRNNWAGRILTAIDLFLVAWLLLSEGFAWFDAHRPLVFLATPAAFVVVILVMDELLAVRALGGCLMLIPFWILRAAFEHPAPSRLLMTTLAYGLAALGMTLVWSPHLFYQSARRLTANIRLGRALLFIISLLGLAMITLGLAVY